MFNKVIRKLINLGFLGPKFLNYFKSLIKYDSTTGFFYQYVNNTRVYFLKIGHGLPKVGQYDLLEWLCKEVYYYHYTPDTNEVVFDIGSGYCHESIWLSKNRRPKIFGIESNPLVHNLALLSTSKFENIKLINCFAGNDGEKKMSLDANYASSSATQNTELSVDIPSYKIEALMEKFNVKKIDLLKVNIEGGELELIKNAPLNLIKRIIVSCHDFRANRSEGEYFRTFEFVKNILVNNNFNIKFVKPKGFPNKAWSKSIPFWIYAEKKI